MNLSRRSLLLAAASGIVAARPLALFAAAEADAAVSEALEELRKKHGLPALAGGVLTTEGLRKSFATGVRKAGESAKVTLKEQWHLGSNTKAMTATLLALYVEEGKLKWDDTLEALIPEDCRGCAEAVKRITVRQLLQHRSGLPANVDWWKIPADKRRDVLRAAAPEGAVIEPGKAYLYSNTGYAVAGRVAEKLGRKSWEAQLEQRIFKSLGMKNAGFGPVGGRRGGGPWPHGPDGKPRPRNEDNAPSLGPAGTVHCTLEDYALFAADHLKGAAGKPALLKPESYGELHEPSPDSPYAGGWAVEEHAWAGGKILTHNGSNTSNYFTAKLAPNKGFGVLACSNQGGEAATQACHALCDALVKAFAAG